jgi:uncharacterized protein (TIGR02594 family)
MPSAVAPPGASPAASSTARPERPAPWLDLAYAEIGQHEIAGNADNARILGYFRDAGQPGPVHDETAWCAAFAGAMLERAGVACTRSLMARSYLHWGQPLRSGRPGAIAVFRRGADAAAGHVGFWLKEADGRVHILGGNQSDRVSVATMPRADLIGLRWPSRLGPSAAEPDMFPAALAHVLAMEGGWTDDPDDPGGPTNFGVTLATFAAYTGVSVAADTFPALKERLRAIPHDMVEDIYRTRYWVPSKAGLMAAPLAQMHFDAAVNHGVAGAARLLQRAVGTTVDGDIGPRTLAAIAALPVDQLLEHYAGERRGRYRSLGHFWRFGRGWLARVDATLLAARRLEHLPAAAADAPPAREADVDDRDPAAAGDVWTGDVRDAKWWGRSMTIWGVLITALAAVVPLLGPAFHIDITPDLIRRLGADVVAVAQAVAALAGTIMAVIGRVNATTRLARRAVTVRL